MAPTRAPSSWAPSASVCEARAPAPHEKTINILACPVTFSPHPQQIEAARRCYGDWWQALGWVREGRIAGGMLREVEVTVAMPKVRPWYKG